MKIVAILTQHRSDFTALIKCEHCGHEQKLNAGYDDENYHMNVMPTIVCNSCGKDRAGKAPKPMESLPTTQYRYYLADPHFGGIKGTNDEKIARQFAADPDYFAVDTQMGTQLACAQETHDTAIPEATDNS